MTSPEYNGVVLSGDPKAGKTTLVAELRRELGWEHHSAGNDIRDYHREEMKKLGEDIPFEKFYPNIPIEVLREINEKTRDIINQGGIIGESRVVHYCEPHILRVYLQADLEVRAERSLGHEEYPGQDLHQVRRTLEGRQLDEMASVHELYEYDYRDASLYDLVINTGRLTVEQEVTQVLAALGMQVNMPERVGLDMD